MALALRLIAYLTELNCKPQIYRIHKHVFYFPTVVCNTLGVLNALRRDRESLIDLDHLWLFPMESDLLAVP